jgi:hypothetical protein
LNNLKRYCVLFFFCILAGQSVIAQKQFKLDVKFSGEESKAFSKRYSYKISFSDSASRSSELNDLLSTIQSDGFLMASVDSIKSDSVLLTAFINTGRKFEWIKLSSGNVPQEILSETDWKEKKFMNKTVKIHELFKLNEQILTFCENKGYPFASIRADSIQATENSLKASLCLQKNSLIVIDSLIIKGKTKLSVKYLYNFLGIKPGDYFNESKISKISDRIKQLQFIKEIKPFHVVFYKEKSKLILYLEKKKNSRFDGILGIAPNNQTSGKLVLTGEVDLDLENSFAHGEMISLKWRKLQQSSQDLKCSFIYPYLFNTPFAFDGKFNLYKNDTIYLTLSSNIGLRYLFQGNDYIKAFYESKSSVLLSTEGYKNAIKLPDYADVRTNLYGLEFKQARLDNIVNPRKGFSLVLSAAAGNRKIIKNTVFNDSLYSKINLNSVQYKSEVQVEYYQHLYGNSVLKLGVNGALIYSDKLFENEIFRFGGLKTLRGFDEESIFASEYIMPVVEYRYLFEENSNVFLFFNQAFYRKKVQENLISDKPFGFGIGVNFETKAGIFSLSYALGKQFENPINLKSAKIHFGIVSYF